MELQERHSPSAMSKRQPAESGAAGCRQEAESAATEIAGQSPAMARVHELIGLVGAGDATVLLIGESGSGKELVARSIHQRGARAGHPFVGLNCGALPDHLQESELFGYEKGAFTGAVAMKPGRFELADRGTLFLDEVGEMSLRAQIDFLRVLETREFRRLGGTKLVRVDVRIIAASNRDLKQAVQEGRFREDLYYRLHVIPIDVPPLRARREDIPLLADRFLRLFAEVHRRLPQELAPETIAKLRAYSWPGNVRELKNLAERLAVTVRDQTILPDHLPQDIVDGRPVPRRDRALAGRLLRDIEKEAIEQTLRQITPHREKAAKLLGISPRALRYKIKEYGIVVEG
jgi:DNA-binding NtrC family response regulator